jgi:integrase
MSLIKPYITRYVDASGRRVPKGTPGAKRKKERSKKWYGQYVIDRKRYRVPLCSDKQAAKAMLGELIRKAEQEGAGLVNPYSAHYHRPLAHHVADWEAHLMVQRATRNDAQAAAGRVRRVIDQAGFRLIPDIDPVRVEQAIAALRQELDFNTQTANHYLQLAKQFCRWLVASGRAAVNPLASLKRSNPEPDRRRARRDLSQDEVRALLEATRRSPNVFRGLTGEDRLYLYATTSGTGFRAAEMRSLVRESFDFDGSRPVVRVVSGCSKNRQEVTQPLSSDLAEALRVYLGGKPMGQPIWPGTWHKKAAVMLRKDLLAARTTWINEAGSDTEKKQREQSSFLKPRNATGRVADFHSLRHTYICMLGRSGANLKETQELARHSDPRLTIGRYTHAALHDLAGAVDNLPSLLPPLSAIGTEQLRATGTDGAGHQLPTPSLLVAPRVAPTECIHRHPAARICTDTREQAAQEESPQVSIDTSLGTPLHPNASLRPEGLEPPTYGSEDHCSVQLSYGRKCLIFSFLYPF